MTDELLTWNAVVGAAAEELGHHLELLECNREVEGHSGAAPASGVKLPPKASERSGRPNRCFLNKNLMAEDQSRPAPAPGAKRLPRASGGPSLPKGR